MEGYINEGISRGYSDRVYQEDIVIGYTIGFSKEVYQRGISLLIN